MTPAQERELAAIRFGNDLRRLLGVALVLADGAVSEALAPVASASTALNQWRREELERVRNEWRALEAARDAETTATLRTAVESAGTSVRALLEARA